MNPRQRRGVLLLLVTVLGAALVFVGVAAYVSSVSSQVGPMTQVLRLTTDVTELHTITEQEVEVVEVPERWAPANAVTSYGQIEGLVSAGNYARGTVLQTGMTQEPPGLTQGYREVAIMVDAETGVAGRIRPGDHVDIIATISVKSADGTETQSAQVIVQNALITEVGIATTVEKEDESGGLAESEKIPVTFALSTQDALRVAYAEGFAQTLRLALRGAGDESLLTDDQSSYSETGQKK